MATLLTVIWARTKQLRAVLWLVLLGAAGLVAAVLALRRRGPAGPTPPSTPPLADTLTALRDRVAATHAQAALEIVAARTGEAITTKGLELAMQDPHGPSRRRALIALAKRLDQQRAP